MPCCTISVFVRPSLLLGAMGCLPVLMAVEGQTSEPQSLDACLQRGRLRIKGDSYARGLEIEARYVAVAGTCC